MNNATDFTLGRVLAPLGGDRGLLVPGSEPVQSSRSVTRASLSFSPARGETVGPHAAGVFALPPGLDTLKLPLNLIVSLLRSPSPAASRSAREDARAANAV